MNIDRRVFRVTLASTDAEAFLAQCRESEWYAVDTGERIMTEEGPDAETILLVEPAARAAARSATALVH